MLTFPDPTDSKAFSVLLPSRHGLHHQDLRFAGRLRRQLLDLSDDAQGTARGTRGHHLPGAQAREPPAMVETPRVFWDETFMKHFWLKHLIVGFQKNEEKRLGHFWLNHVESIYDRMHMVFGLNNFWEIHIVVIFWMWFFQRIFVGLPSWAHEQVAGCFFLVSQLPWLPPSHLRHEDLQGLRQHPLGQTSRFLLTEGGQMLFLRRKDGARFGAGLVGGWGRLEVGWYGWCHSHCFVWNMITCLGLMFLEVLITTFFGMTDYWLSDFWFQLLLGLEQLICTVLQSCGDAICLTQSHETRTGQRLGVGPVSWCFRGANRWSPRCCGCRSERQSIKGRVQHLAPLRRPLVPWKSRGFQETNSFLNKMNTTMKWKWWS